MLQVTPFKIDIPEEKIGRLRQKLALADFPDEITDLNSDETWSRGVPLSEVKRLAAYWEHGFDWRKAEASLNELPQYTTNIEVESFGSYVIHFVHQKSTITDAIPLLFLHGWPGSFIEVTKILPQLLQGGESSPAFHVVAPSLIDFGFSSASKKKAFHIDQHAEAYHALMLGLGYDEYVIQAGDMGSLATRMIASKYGPKHCKAYHVNNAVPAEPTAESHPELHAKIQATPLSDAEAAGLARTAEISTEGRGYYHQQSTKPQTLGYSLADSPVGLLAWIYEKLHDWTDNYPWTDDEVLTWVSIYYFSTAGPTAPGYLYYSLEHNEPRAFPKSQLFVDVPIGIARFARDLILFPKLWNHTLGPLVFESEYKRGGHLAAWECPDEVVNDLHAMFGKDGPAGGCVKGKSGYKK